MGGKEGIPPYTINTISSRQVMRIKINFNSEIIGWSNTSRSFFFSSERGIGVGDQSSSTEAKIQKLIASDGGTVRI